MLYQTRCFTSVEPHEGTELLLGTYLTHGPMYPKVKLRK